MTEEMAAELAEGLSPSERHALFPGDDGIFLSTIAALEEKKLLKPIGELGWDYTNLGRCVREIIRKEQGE